MKRINPFKGLKKAVYKGTLSNIKSILSFMIIGGILLSSAYFFRFAYMEYAVADAHIVMTYPEIATSGYPDGSRFAYYDFVSDDKLEAALEIMKSKGKYQNFTVEDIKEKFFVYSYLDGSAISEVSTNRSKGNDFSYVANEYDITFVQPHDYKSKKFFERFVAPDYSDEFLRALVRVNKEYISEKKGGLKGFENLTNVDDFNYDYDEQITVYKTKINAIVSYLSSIEKESPDFTSAKYNLTIKDLKGKYKLLITNKLDSIDNFVDSSAISKNVEVASNKTNVNIETTTLKCDKANDRLLINDYATTNYDHTFTENLINVVRDDKQGLYQARPKTAFDTVVDQKNAETELVSEYTTKIGVLNDELSRFAFVSSDSQENKRLSEKAETLLSDMEKEYSELTAISKEVVDEYLNEINKHYITAKIEKDSILSKRLLIKLAIMFVVGAFSVFVFCIWLSVLADERELRRKKKMIEEIRSGKKRGVI